MHEGFRCPQGEAKAAITLLQRARQIDAAESGAHSVPALLCAVSLAECLTAAGDVAAAESLLAETVPVRPAVRSPWPSVPRWFPSVVFRATGKQLCCRPGTAVKLLWREKIWRFRL
jgi:hypothetical protein